MNKEELVRAVSKQVDLNQDKVSKTINVILQEITQALSKGDSVKFVGFGNFTVIKRPAKNGRNPKTGVPIKIPARDAAKFTAGKILKNAVRSRK